MTLPHLAVVQGRLALVPMPDGLHTERVSRLEVTTHFAHGCLSYYWSPDWVGRHRVRLPTGEAVLTGGFFALDWTAYKKAEPDEYRPPTKEHEARLKRMLNHMKFTRGVV